MLRIVDYRNLGSEELGSVYESLLELHPVMNAEAKAFDLSTAAGNERKTTGSYYTPDSLVQCLLDSALDPVVEDRLTGKKGEDAEQAILAMKVCDPACGSGHFLIAAAHRLARHLARVRTGESEPSPEDYQHALRDVIGRCVYGVDLNPMAVELCKVSLWMEAIEPGKPLSFLDHHIQCGNSLLGTTPALLTKGVPDDAFMPIEGDVKQQVNALKRDNKRERQDYESGQGYLFSPTLKLGNLPATISQINVASEESVEDVTAKQEMYEKLVKGADYLNARLLADTWCAAFVWKKDDSDLGRLCPTERVFRSIEDNPRGVNIHVKAEIRRLSEGYQFFHWHLAFPDVFQLPGDDSRAENSSTCWNGGFDVVLGNPPWEKIHLRDEEFFAERAPEIADASTKAKRKRLIDKLKTEHPQLYREYQEEKQKHDHISAFFRLSGYFPLTGVSRINLYSVFAETAHRIVGVYGRFGLVLASGLLTDDNNKHYFDALISNKQLVHAWDFENSKAIFPAIHRSYKFALIGGCGAGIETSLADFAFYLSSEEELQNEWKHFSLSAEELALLNPNTKACPAFRSKSDAEVNLHIYKRIPAVDVVTSSTDWPGDIKTPFNSANDSKHFKTRRQLADEGAAWSAELYAKVDGESWLPIYEPKFIHQFSHRFASFAFDGEGPGSSETIDVKELESPQRYVAPRNWLTASLLSERFPGEWFLVVRNITGALNERTSIAAIIPKRPCVDANLLLGLRPTTALMICANMNAFAYDYLARQKIAGTHFNQFIWKQIPLIRPQDYENTKSLGAESLIPKCSLELTYTAWDLKGFAAECEYKGPPFLWDEDRRFLLRCELDAAYFHLYLGNSDEWGTGSSRLREVFATPRDAVTYIMDSFPIVKRRDIARTADENGENGRYITKETILEIYDEMAAAIRTGQTYQTRLDPPPGPPTDAEDNFIPVAEWDENNWPSHIHQPR
ncbi:MAG: N-6 DNA methylase [Pirellulales bacterium]